MTLTELYLVLGLGFISSLHCVQMCGPIVLTYSVGLSANKDGARPPLIWAHLAYNAGRTVTYSALGALAGLVGGSVGFLGGMMGVQNTAAVVAGAAMLVAGLLMLGFGPGRRLFRNVALPTRFLRPVGSLISSPSLRSKFGLGLLLGFLPCGLVYGALLRAVGTASALHGALTLVAFGAGTSLALVAIGLGSSVATRYLARWGTTVAAATVMAMGAMLILRVAAPGLMMFGGH